MHSTNFGLYFTDIYHVSSISAHNPVIWFSQLRIAHRVLFTKTTRRGNGREMGSNTSGVINWFTACRNTCRQWQVGAPRPRASRIERLIGDIIQNHRHATNAKAVKGLWFESRPGPVHPNCKCEIEEFEAIIVTGRSRAIIVPPGVDLAANIACCKASCERMSTQSLDRS